MQAWRQQDVAWQDRSNPVTAAAYQAVRLWQDAVAGMELILVRYPAGSVTPDHRHPCAHGMVVLEGRLHTQSGVFGPGDVIWYAEGERGSHGATAEGPVMA